MINIPRTATENKKSNLPMNDDLDLLGFGISSPKSNTNS